MELKVVVELTSCPSRYSAAELDNPYAVPVDVYTLLEPQESTDMFVPGKGEFVIVFTHGKEVLKLEHRRVQ